MAHQRERESPPPRNKWAEIVYRLLSAGRYAILWLPELMELLSKQSRDEGDEAGKTSLMRELVNAIVPSISIRVYRLFRFVYVAWKAYKKLAGD